MAERTGRPCPDCGSELIRIARVAWGDEWTAINCSNDSCLYVEADK